MMNGILSSVQLRATQIITTHDKSISRYLASHDYLRLTVRLLHESVQKWLTRLFWILIIVCNIVFSNSSTHTATDA
jgi:hypothetical protein